MTEDLTKELCKVKRQLTDCRRKLKEAENINERLRESIGYDELEGWKPQERIEKQYGWVFAWLYPLGSYMNSKLNKPLTPDIRNKIHNIVTAIIAQMAVSGKYGIKLPFDPQPENMDYQSRQMQIFRKTYDPCELCGEDRITHECHIIPRSEGGPWHKSNLITLCPLHHHLFDHSRLSRNEWELLSNNLGEKMEAAVAYANEVRLPQLQRYWKGRGKKYA